MVLILNPKEKYQSLVITCILTLIIFAVFVASNRISFVILFFSFFLLIYLLKILRRNLIYSLILAIPVFYIVFQNDVDIKTRYSGFIFKTKDALTSFIKPPQNNI